MFGEEKPRLATVVDLMQQFVFQMLAYDLVPYARRGGGLVKVGLQKSALVQLLTVHFEFLGSEKPPMKKQHDLKKLPYPALWEEVKARTLAECGLTVGQRSQDKILWTAAGNKTGPAKDGEWRSRVFCLDPWQQADEVVEDPREKLAKRTRYVAGAAQEQSMGLPGNVLHEVALPVDVDALTCQLDKETCSEWDALNPFLKFLNNGALSDRFAADLVDEVPAWTARGSAGMSYSESLRLIRDASLLTVPVAVPDVDPTQQSFVDHMTAFAEAFLAVYPIAIRTTCRCLFRLDRWTLGSCAIRCCCLEPQEPARQRQCKQPIVFWTPKGWAIESFAPLTRVSQLATWAAAVVPSCRCFASALNLGALRCRGCRQMTWRPWLLNLEIWPFWNWTKRQ